MKHWLFITIFTTSFGFVAGQGDTLYNLKKLGETEVNFLYHYYEQDGNRSAVTGGIGTQELTDNAGTIIINVPLDSVSRLNINTNLNYYTSASTDRINTIMSSASADDFRGQLYMTYSEDLGQVNRSFTLGGATESDYLSLSLGGSWGKISKDENRSITLRGQAFFDRWQLFFPDELRGNPETYLPTDRRYAYDLSTTFTQVITPRLQAAITLDVALQHGLLSTPFHRIYYADTTVGLERLPNLRFKQPTALRLHYFLGDFVVLRFYYRYYWDSFDIQAHTINLETPFKIGTFLTVYPFYRYHTQSAARYFQPYANHDVASIYHTSDYDLSAFQSQKYGVGIRLSPVYGIGRFKLSSRKLTMLKYGEVRYAIYRRSDGLHANMVSFDFGFRIK